MVKIAIRHSKIWRFEINECKLSNRLAGSTWTEIYSALNFKLNSKLHAMTPLFKFHSSLSSHLAKASFGGFAFSLASSLSSHASVFSSAWSACALAMERLPDASTFKYTVKLSQMLVSYLLFASIVFSKYLRWWTIQLHATYITFSRKYAKLVREKKTCAT